jgi:hypothetical protein
MSGPPKPPTDVMGNIILPETLVVLTNPPFTIVWRVSAVEPGGLATPQGTTPALVRLYSDITLRRIPGLPFVEIARIAVPSEQSILEGIADSLPTLRRQ